MSYWKTQSVRHTRSCKGCNAQFTTYADKNARWCSDDCRPAPKTPGPRTCQNPECGDDVSHLHGNSIYCNQRCASRAVYIKKGDKIRERNYAYYLENQERLHEEARLAYQADPERFRNYSRKYAAKKTASRPPRPAPEPRVWKDKRQQAYYENVITPRGQRLSGHLDSLFRSQAALDPSRIPELASRVLEWRPKGYIAALQYALHPWGPLEADWMYYAEMSPEEAVEVYALED